MVGAIQPFAINLYNAAIVFCVISILILVTQLFVNQNRTETHVLSKEFSFAEFDSKDFVSESFTLEGGSAPITISVHSDVDNSWANAQIALVNETTNDEIYASKDIEYYSGYTEGESWSEGSNSESFNLCGVPAGQYHLTISSMKAPEDVTSDFIKVKAVWSEPSSRNIWIVLICMIVVLVGLFYLERNFEERRWADSSYSEYNS